VVPNAWLRIRRDISTARKHEVNVLPALRDAITGNPWRLVTASASVTATSAMKRPLPAHWPAEDPGTAFAEQVVREKLDITWGVLQVVPFAVMGGVNGAPASACTKPTG